MVAAWPRQIEADHRAGSLDEALAWAREGDAVVNLLIVCVLMLAIVLIPGLLKRRLRPTPDPEADPES